jgi:Bacterial DNA-binding protein
MKKALLMGMSGALIALISSNAHALTQSEAEDNYITKHGGDKANIHAKFNAWEKVLKDELAAKHAVKIDGLGTFNPKEKVGTRTYKGFNGKVARLTTTSW